MSDFAGMEDLMQDFLIESSGMLSDIDSMLLDLEHNPADSHALNAIFRNFHTIKGGAGFLNATELVALCHLAESLFDKLRIGELSLHADLMDVIRALMEQVRRMFGDLSENLQPGAAPPGLIETLNAILAEKNAASRTQTGAAIAPAPKIGRDAHGPDWNMLYRSVAGDAAGSNRAAESTGPAYEINSPFPPVPASARPARRTTDVADSMPDAFVRSRNHAARRNTIRVNADRLNQALDPVR